jgi:glyoxylase-like metal-dependent hydrolase (beta-lactamase superfamily II)
MKYVIIFLVTLIGSSHANTLHSLNQKTWIHGAEDCSNNQDPAIDVFQFSESSYILRQNKCLNFEAPFIYVLFGTHTVFVQDTGATAEAELFPLYDLLQKLITERSKSQQSNKFNILVTHSHSHGDHTAADLQFRGKPNVTLIEPNAESVHRYFGFTDWPKGSATIDLGERELTIIPIPGHQDESIAVYDAQTRWLLTGDTFYPGRLYIRDWNVYRSSIKRLMDFSEHHTISAILGTHIEMSNIAGKDYPMGSTFQPDEAELALSVTNLNALNKALAELGNKPQQKIMSKFIISPIGALQRYLGGFLGWIKKKVE